METTTQTKRSKKGLFIGLGLFAASVLSFFGYQYYKSNRQQSKTPPENAPDLNAEKPKTQTHKPSQHHQKKPPAKQQGTHQNNPAVNLSTIQKKVMEPSLMAKGLYAAVRAKSFMAAIKILKLIKKPSEYSAINKVFITYHINGVRQTLVNALLNTFTTDTQKQQIRLAFTAMGLKYDGKKWSLDGLYDAPLIITTQKTKVWKDPRNWVEVPNNMVLGKEIAKRNKHTVFENDRKFFLVETGHVTKYKK